MNYPIFDDIMFTVCIETKDGLKSDSPIEATIFFSSQFRSILKIYCNIDLVVEGNTEKATIKSTDPHEIRNMKKLLDDIKEGRLKDDAGGVVNVD